MRVVKAERWHQLGEAGPAGERRCSVCASPRLGAPGETVIDGETTRRYQVVRCHDCGYDLLAPVRPILRAAS